MNYILCGVCLGLLTVSHVSAFAQTSESANSTSSVSDLMNTNTEDLDASVREQLQKMEAGAGAKIGKAGALASEAEKAGAAAAGIESKDAASESGTTLSATTESKGSGKLDGKSEAEIPVLSKTKKGESKEESLGTRMALSFGVVVILMLAGGLYLRRYRQSSREKSKHTQIKVLTQHFLGPKKSLAIVRVAGESVLIGVTDHTISLIKQLHTLDEELPEEERPEIFGRNLSRRMETPAQNSDSDDDDMEAFAMRSIQDRVTGALKKKRFLS